MYWIVIGWLYVALMFAAAQGSLVRSVVMALFVGILPVWFVLWVKIRRLRTKRMLAQEAASQQSDASGS
jgi:hypothetical protein